MGRMTWLGLTRSRQARKEWVIQSQAHMEYPVPKRVDENHAAQFRG